jgi:hypothetical protein
MIPFSVIPAKAGIQLPSAPLFMGSRFRGNDVAGFNKANRA